MLATQQERAQLRMAHRGVAAPDDGGRLLVVAGDVVAR